MTAQLHEMGKVLALLYIQGPTSYLKTRRFFRLSNMGTDWPVIATEPE